MGLGQVYFPDYYMSPVQLSPRGPDLYASPVTEYDTVGDQLRMQIEYYFSDANLSKDFFMRRKMDKDGWIPVELIANFRRVLTLGADVSQIIQALKTSEAVETSDDGLRMRCRVNPSRWVVEGIDPTQFSSLKPTAVEFVPSQLLAKPSTPVHSGIAATGSGETAAVSLAGAATATIAVAAADESSDDATVTSSVITTVDEKGVHKSSTTLDSMSAHGCTQASAPGCAGVESVSSQGFNTSPTLDDTVKSADSKITNEASSQVPLTSGTLLASNTAATAAATDTSAAAPAVAAAVSTSSDSSPSGRKGLAVNPKPSPDAGHPLSTPSLTAQYLTSQSCDELERLRENTGQASSNAVILVEEQAGRDAVGSPSSESVRQHLSASTTDKSSPSLPLCHSTAVQHAEDVKSESVFQNIGKEEMNRIEDVRSDESQNISSVRVDDENSATKGSGEERKDRIQDASSAKEAL